MDVGITDRDERTGGVCCTDAGTRVVPGTGCVVETGCLLGQGVLLSVEKI